MTKQYRVGECWVDLSRNQITRDNEPQSLQPKALDVLTWLAKHQGQVVSQDDLFDNVWTGTVVSPNTLQRCIAQLRKAMGDDSRQQKAIKTHAKKGYSLEYAVHWDAAPPQPEKHLKSKEPLELNIDTGSINEIQSVPEEPGNVQPKHDDSDKESEPKQQNEFIALKSRQKTLNGSVIMVLMIVFVAAFMFLSSWSVTDSHYQISIADMRPVTSTDNRELASIYSPDGEYVVFKRFPEIMCISHLWAKNLTTQQEFRLTEAPGSYGRLSFSADGSTLAFVKQEDCTNTPDRDILSQKTCYQLQSLNFHQAMNSPVMADVHMECINSTIRDAKWLNSQDIALLQMRTGRWQLIRYSVLQDEAEVIFAPESGNLIHYDYSPSLNLIAMISLSDEHQLFINMLTPDGSVLSSHPIIFPEELARYSLVYPNFSNLDNRLIFSTGRRLFTLSEKGDIKNINVPLDKAMGTPIFHPDGKRMLAIKGFYDSDIVTVALAQFAKLGRVEGHSISADEHFEYHTIDRSSAGDYFAKSQPNGDLMAFQSNRSGEYQIWLQDGQSSRQLSQFPIDTYFRGFDWAADGKSLLVNASSELFQIFLDGRSETLLPDLPVAELLDWDSNALTALAKIRISGVIKFVEIDLSQQNFRILNETNVIWAQKTKSGEIIYMDHLHRFWRPGNVEDKLIPDLDGQGSDKRFIVKDQTLYGINSDFQLWTYDLTNHQFDIIANLPETVDYLSDLVVTRQGEKELLMTLRVAARKDVVEMTLK